MRKIFEPKKEQKPIGDGGEEEEEEPGEEGAFSHFSHKLLLKSFCHELMY